MIFHAIWARRRFNKEKAKIRLIHHRKEQVDLNGGECDSESRREIKGGFWDAVRNGSHSYIVTQQVGYSSTPEYITPIFKTK